MNIDLFNKIYARSLKVIFDEKNKGLTCGDILLIMKWEFGRKAMKEFSDEIAKSNGIDITH